MEPGIEPRRVAQTGQVAPGSDIRLLDGVSRELRVAEDEAGDSLQLARWTRRQAIRRRHDRLDPLARRDPAGPQSPSVTQPIRPRSRVLASAAREVVHLRTHAAVQGGMTILTASPDRMRARPAAVSSSGIVALIIGARSSSPGSTRSDRGREREVRDVRAVDRQSFLDDLDLVDRRVALAVHPEHDHPGAHRGGPDAWGRTLPTASTTTSAPPGASARPAAQARE